MDCLLRWYGGKFHIAQEIIKFFPEHRIYVEVFGGGASILFQKKPSILEIYNDIDHGLVNFFKVLRENSEELQKKLKLTPYAREEFEQCRLKWREEGDEIEKARMWFVIARQSFSGVFGTSWSAQLKVPPAPQAATWTKRIDNLMQYAMRLKQVQIENLDALELINRYDGHDVLFYLDPPYVEATRKTSKGYVNGLTDKYHAEMVKKLNEVKGKIILSGYNNQIYDNLGWKKIKVANCLATAKRSAPGSRKDLREELIWINFESPVVGMDMDLFL